MSPYDLLPETPAALGMVLEEGRGSLPFALIHGEPLVRCAALALEAAQIEPIDARTSWAEVGELLTDRAEVIVLHDALCPTTPPAFLARCAALAAGSEAVVVAYRPVTDTIKHVDADLVGATVDRESLRALASPVAFSARVAQRLPGPPGQDLAALVAGLHAHHLPVEWVEAPAEAQRVADRDSLRLLEALTRR